MLKTLVCLSKQEETHTNRLLRMSPWAALITSVYLEGLGHFGDSP